MPEIADAGRTWVLSGPTGSYALHLTEADELVHLHWGPRISLADAKKDFDDGAAIIIDARNEEAYKQEHIKGALNLAKGVNDEQLNKIPKGTKIIVYCS